MHLFVNDRYYSYPDNAHNIWRYSAGSILGLMAQYEFTEEGIDLLNNVSDEIDDAEITESRRLYLQNQFKIALRDLILTGKAIKKRNSEFELTVKWWETTVPQTD